MYNMIDGGEDGGGIEGTCYSDHSSML
jgi:hypothetical protein